MTLDTFKRNIIILGFCFSVFASKAETKVFDIKLAGMNIGKVYASHTVKDDIDYYSITGSVELNLFISIKITYQTLSVFKNNKLIESMVTSNVNGTKYSSTTKWTGDNYIINCNAYNYQYSDSSKTTPINYSVSKLYFDKPSAGKEIYAETYGLLGEIKPIHGGEMKFEIPKSQIIFHYDKTGNLVNVEMVNPVKNFEIIKSKV